MFTNFKASIEKLVPNTHIKIWLEGGTYHKGTIKEVKEDFIILSNDHFDKESGKKSSKEYSIVINTKYITSFSVLKEDDK